VEQRNKAHLELGQLSNWTIADFLKKLASDEPVPGGGSVAAFAGALGAALIVMYCKIGMHRKGVSGDDQEVLQKISIESASYELKLTRLITEDSQVYSSVMEAFKLPKTTEDEAKARQQTIQRTLKNAAETPLHTVRACLECLYLIGEVSLLGNPSAFSDLKVAQYLCYAGGKGALENIEINLISIKDPEFVKEMEAKVNKIRESFEQANRQKILPPQ
jgi:methenyltetrahydrofolate cyclohydrolase